MPAAIFNRYSIFSNVFLVTPSTFTWPAVRLVTGANEERILAAITLLSELTRASLPAAPSWSAIAKFISLSLASLAVPITPSNSAPHASPPSSPPCGGPLSTDAITQFSFLLL